VTSRARAAPPPTNCDLAQSDGKQLKNPLLRDASPQNSIGSDYDNNCGTPGGAIEAARRGSTGAGDPEIK